MKTPTYVNARSCLNSLTYTYLLHFPFTFNITHFFKNMHGILYIILTGVVTSSSTEEIRTKPTVQQLHAELQSVQHRWYGIGLQLGLPPATLHTIRHDSWGDCEMCMVSTCEAWLNAKCDACWQEVVKALTTIRHQVLAEEIKTKYCTCEYLQTS